MSKIPSVFALALALGSASMVVTSQLVAQTTPPSIQFITAQPADQSLARVFLGAAVKNPDGETVGEIHDLMFDKSGNISTVVIGVGGFLGMGEKFVAVPYAALLIGPGKDGTRTIILKASKGDLTLAPAFSATEKTTMDVVRDKAVDLGHKAAEKASELKDQAAKKIDDLSKGTPAKK